MSNVVGFRNVKPGVRSPVRQLDTRSGRSDQVNIRLMLEQVEQFLSKKTVRTCYQDSCCLTFSGDDGYMFSGYR